MDAIGRFVKDCCVLGDGEKTSASDLYKKFQKWADGEYDYTSTQFGKLIKMVKGVEPSTSGSKRLYKGIRIKDDIQDG